MWLDRVASAFSIDRLWQRAWDRHGPHYSWMVFLLSYAATLPMWEFTALTIVRFEDSDRYLAGSAVALGALFVAMYVLVLPGFKAWRLVERWAAGEPVDRLEALESTYAYCRRVVVRGAAPIALIGAATCVGLGAIAGADLWHLVQYGIIGATLLPAVQLIAIHQFPEAFARPVRRAIAADSGIGEALPRSRPSFATWSNISMITAAWSFTFGGAIIAAVFARAMDNPAFALVIATAMALVFAVPITVGAAFAPSLLPIRDLAEGTKRVAAGDYGQRLPVVQDDDLGALAASFNRMQAGLAERERLHAAFGSYVDPALAARLLAQGDDIFTGERLEVTVMFVDVRDFTPFAESHAAEEAVSQLNALFEIVVPAVLDAGGHVNKYLGDGAMAVFGAPNSIAHHADAAVNSALRIQRLVAEHFAGELRIGIGINSGTVIAGTIGGAGKLEFTLIGDAVNVAARVEQLTKSTRDTILITQDTLDALAKRPPEALVDRGLHDLKGKSTAVRVYALDGSLESDHEVAAGRG